MSHYLPTISLIINKNEIPSNIETDIEVQYQLLGEFEKNCYTCTTRNWEHVESIKKITQHLQLHTLDFISDECVIISLEKTENLLNELKIIENFIQNNSKIKAYLLNDLNSSIELNKTHYLKHYSEKEFEKLKSYFEEQKTIINNTHYSNIYQQIEVSKDISEFDLKDQFTNCYHDFISVLYWLKSYIHITKKAIAKQNNILHIFLTP